SSTRRWRPTARPRPTGRRSPIRRAPTRRPRTAPDRPGPAVRERRCVSLTPLHPIPFILNDQSHGYTEQSATAERSPYAPEEAVQGEGRPRAWPALGPRGRRLWDLPRRDHSRAGEPGSVAVQGWFFRLE